MASPGNSLLDRLRIGTVRTKLLRGGLVIVAATLILGATLATNVPSTPARLLGGLGILVLCGGALHLLFQRLLGSLDELVGTAQRMAGGDLSVRAASSDSEIGRLGRYINVLVDRQKVTVGRVEVSRRKLEDLLGSLPLEIALFDAKGRYLYEKPDARCDSTDSRLALGMSATELYAMREQDALGREIDAAVAQCLEGGAPVTIQQHVLTGDGAREFTRVYTPVDPDQSDAVRVVGYGLDVSEQRRAEATLRERDEQLRQAQKLESIGRLAGGVAHDFEQLLTSMLNSIEHALGADSVPEQARTSLETAKADTLQAKILTGQLLAFGRQQVLRPEVVDLTLLVREAEMMLRRLVGRHIRVDSSHPDEALLVDVDAAKLEQVLLRLVLNARDAMFDGGRLTIATELVDLSERPAGATGSFEPGTYAVVTVGDTGVGMDDTTLSEIFEPFSSANVKNNGPGLGLSAVEGTVSQSGGFLTVESEVGQGTVFRIHFKRVGASSQPSQDLRRAADRDDVEKRGTALVAAADDLLREFMRLTLERAGFDVVAAADGGSAIDCARDHDGEIELFITDVTLPGVSASDAVRVISSLRPDVCVLPVASTPGEALEHQAAMGEVLYLREPFESWELADAVDRVLKEPAPVSARGVE